jgi:tRNA (pseudouridine54-N1)-methyltransferase
MREIVYFSRSAYTTGNFKDLMKAGRLDIVCHVVIASLFISHKIREDVNLHLIFYGPPDPPKHLEITSSEELKKIISKKDVGGLIKRMLYKYRPEKKIECFPGCKIEKKSLIKVVEELAERKEIFIMDKKGKDVKEVKFRNPVFIIGDHQGIPMAEKKRLEKIATKLSLGKEIYFSSQVVVILHYLLDREDEKE